MECARQKRILLFARVDYIQSQCKDANRREFKLGDAICCEHAIFTSIASFTQVENFLNKKSWKKLKQEIRMMG